MSREQSAVWCKYRARRNRPCPLTLADGAARRFCPECGRPNFSAQLVDDSPIGIPPGQISVDVEFESLGGIDGEILVVAETEGFSVPQAKVPFKAGERQIIYIQGPEIAPDDQISCVLKLRMNNGVRTLDRLSTLRIMEDAPDITLEFYGERAPVEFDLTTAVMHPSRRYRLVRLSAGGQVPLPVDLRPSLPGLKLLNHHGNVARRSVVLTPTDPEAMYLHVPDGNVSSGEIVALHDNREVAKLGFVWCATSTEPVKVAPITLGIDFGTSGTSAYVLNLYDGEWDKAQPVIDPGETSTRGFDWWKRRWPSVVALNDSLTSDKWEFGIAAQEKANDPAYKGGIITRVKSELRKEQRDLKVEIRGEIQTVSVDSVVEFIFRQIKKRVYEQFPYIRNGLDEGQIIRAIFSLPVLDKDDKGELYQRQKDRTLAIARKVFSGFIIEDRLEPVCGANYVALLAKQGNLLSFDESGPGTGRRITLKDRTPILIYDGGGGTTDIVVGRLSVSNNDVSVTEMRTYSATRKDGDSYGGTVATDVWLKYFCTSGRGPDFIDHGKRLEEGTGGRVVNVPDEDSPAQEFSKAFPLLWQEMERSKVEINIEDNDVFLSTLNGALAVTKNMNEAYKKGGDVESQVNHIKRILEEARVRGMEVEYIIMIGGNSNLRPLQSVFTREFPELKIIVPTPPTEDFNLMDIVPRGVCSKNIVPINALPYKVTVRYRGENPARAISFAPGEEGQEKVLDMPANSEVEILAKLNEMDDTLLLARVKMPDVAKPGSQLINPSYSFIVESEEIECPPGVPPTVGPVLKVRRKVEGGKVATMTLLPL